LGYRRSQRSQDPNNTLVEIDGVKSTEAARFYLGKRVAYVYPVKRQSTGKKFRVVWGRYGF
jgi:large subunit ribosomal protein L35Ae